MKDAIKVKRRSKINCPDCNKILKVKRNVLYFACPCGCIIEIVVDNTERYKLVTGSGCEIPKGIFRDGDGKRIEFIIGEDR